MNTLADCAIARHGGEIASASITVQPALTAPGQVHTFARQSLYRWDKDEQLIEAALAGYWTPGRAPTGGKWVRPCMSGGNGLFDGGR
jgi:hypothetical protein